MPETSFGSKNVYALIYSLKIVEIFTHCLITMANLLKPFKNCLLNKNMIIYIIY